MTYYELLEISESASEEVIHMAYKALVKKYHPDIYTGDKSYAEAKMKEINIAYSVLSNSVKRAEYDSFLKEQSKGTYQNVEEASNIIKKSKKKNLKFALLLASVFLVVALFLLVFSKPVSIEEVKDSVVMIKAYDKNDNLIATGSGFCAFDENSIVTNYHVIEGAYEIIFITDDGLKNVVTDVVIYNKANDLAILKSITSLKPIPFGNTENLKAGDKVTAIGSPEGQLNTVSEGIVSNADDDYQIRITAPISPGSSGGVLLNDKNKIIGVTYASYDDETAQNLNYAIRADILNEMYSCFVAKAYTTISDSFYKEILGLSKITTPKEPTEKEAYEVYMATAGISNRIDEYSVENTYFSPKTIEVFGYLTSPIEKYVYSLMDSSYFKWYAVYNGLTEKEKQLAYELYKELEKQKFDNKNVSKNVKKWSKAEFFINLNILSKEEFSVLATDLKDISSDKGAAKKIKKYSLKYAEGLLIRYLFGYCRFSDLSDYDKEKIFDYFDEFYFESIKDMGGILKVLGYEVRYDSDGGLTASWQ